jgi:hypothetical protein
MLIEESCTIFNNKLPSLKLYDIAQSYESFTEWLLVCPV